MMATMQIEIDDFEIVRAWREKMQIALALSRATEETLADLVAAYTPLLAPVIPAAIGFANVKAGLGFDWPLAFVYAVIVECLGLATTTTALQFRAWNNESDKKAPMGWALAMAVFYLAVVLIVNTLLDTGTTIQKVVKGAASTFSIVGAVTMALRNEQAKRVAAKVASDKKADDDQLAAEEREYKRKVDEQERERRFLLKQQKLQLTGESPERAETPRRATGDAIYKVWHDVPESEYAFIRQASPAQIVVKYQLDGKDPERKARQWKQYASGGEA